MCNREWEKGVGLAIEKIEELGIVGAIDYGKNNLNSEADYFKSMGFNDCLRELEVENEK